MNKVSQTDLRLPRIACPGVTDIGFAAENLAIGFVWSWLGMDHL
jgi:hypothetical protein